MPRSIWTGSISFGLVNIPVKAFTAVRDHTIHFHQLDKKSGARVRYKKVSEKTGKELEADDIESAYEISSGTYVPVDTDELNDLRPRTTKTIDVDDFVELSAIDPIFFDKTYWLGPDGEAAGRAYGLLHAAMTESGKAGIGKVVMRTKQYLAAIRPVGDALAMSTMRFADEVVDSDEVVDLPGGKDAKPSPKERGLATQIIDSLTTDWKPERYHDTYTEQLQELIKAKAKGKDIVVEDQKEAPGGDVVDLMAALEASLQASKGAKSTKSTKSTKKAAPKKSTAKKAPARKAS